ncbi:HNH endonuclease [Ensifer sp. PDNC004]|uniref:HNH endonuclease n=1 Tax=Ensifer sp. PDNC004 TaxID=2811423 RepID=UPI001965BC13|nr:HNH endonuclease [Ensifer sp. PDNC004]QRY69152.1 HNH endonuclease [Ensifer sp. PDNC004]
MTDVGTTRRGTMSPMRRLRIFEAHGGRCCLCEGKIDGVRQKWTIEHLIALGLGGKDDDGNCAPAHEECRRGKDKLDVTAIAKAKRIKAKHLGIAKPKSSLSNPRFRKLMNGDVVDRRTGEVVSR